MVERFHGSCCVMCVARGRENFRAVSIFSPFFGIPPLSEQFRPSIAKKRTEHVQDMFMFRTGSEQGACFHEKCHRFLIIVGGASEFGSFGLRRKEILKRPKHLIDFSENMANMS